MNGTKPDTRPIGWPLLTVPDSDGRLTYPTLESSVRQSIQIILRTRPGEQLMRRRFGAGLDAFLHEPNTLTTRRRIHDRIVESLAEWEPRIAVDRVDVRELPDRPAHIRVEIAYRILRTGLGQTMGITLELEA